MLKHYFTIGVRILKKYPVFSAINIVSLSLSMSVCLLVITMIKQQFSFDNFHYDSERIYRINTKVNTLNAGNNQFATSPFKLRGELEKFPAVEFTTTLRPLNAKRITYELNAFNLQGAFADAAFFSVFNFPHLGSVNLSDPSGIILTATTANKIFGKADPIGKIVVIKDAGTFIVSGIIKNEKIFSHINYDYLLSSKAIPLFEKNLQQNINANEWANYYSSYTYVKIRPNQQNIDVILQTLSKKVTGLAAFDKVKSVTFFPQSIISITPHKGYILENTKGMSYTSITILVIFVTVLMLLACFNYSSLTIARALTRTKEVGMRKVFGATRRQVIFQFIIESIILSVISLFLATAILPYIPLNDSLRKAAANNQMDASLAILFILFSLFSGTVAGLLPGWMFSKYQPIQVIRKLSDNNFYAGIKFRKVLICSQFVISFILIINLVVFYKQATYMATSDYGYDSSNKVSISISENKQYNVIKEELKKLSKVTGVSGISTNFGNQPTAMLAASVNKNAEPVNLSAYYADAHAIPEFRLSILAGQNFNSSSTGGAQQIIVNETAVKALGFGSKISCLGKVVHLNDTTDAVIVGMVKDFNFQNLKVPIAPMALFYRKDSLAVINASIAPGQLADLQEDLTRIERKLGLQQKIEWYKYDDQLREQQLHVDDLSMFGFMVLIFLSLTFLGLLGITMFIVEQRAKEVNIRKILGASTWDLFRELSKEYLGVLVIASCIALPISYIIASQVLKGFAYKIPLNITSLLPGWFAVLMIGIMIISSQTIKSAVSSKINRVE